VRLAKDLREFVELLDSRRVEFVAAGAHAPFAPLGSVEDDFVKPDRVIQLGYPPNRIDLMTSISGATIEEVWQSREYSSLDGIPVSFIGRKALVRNKTASGRLKDAAAVESPGGPVQLTMSAPSCIPGAAANAVPPDRLTTIRRLN
jgi:hypothetical protein